MELKRERERERCESRASVRASRFTLLTIIIIDDVKSLVVAVSGVENVADLIHTVLHR